MDEQTDQIRFHIELKKTQPSRLKLNGSAQKETQL